jgi:hypothetical protein
VASSRKKFSGFEFFLLRNRVHARDSPRERKGKNENVVQVFGSGAIIGRSEDRRSQRKSHNWDGFNQLLAQFGVVKPHIVNLPRRVRMAFVPGLA